MSIGLIRPGVRIPIPEAFSPLQPRVPPARSRRSGTVDSVRRFTNARRTLTKFAFFLERKVQAFREAAEGQGRTPKRGVLLVQSGEFLATARTVISHKLSPF
jgi:hypothetical protein